MRNGARVGDGVGASDGIAEGTPDDIGANQEVIDAYLGAHTDSDFFDDLEEEVTAEGARLAGEGAD